MYYFCLQMFASCYGDTEIGPLECDEIEGYLAHNSDMVLQCAENMEKEFKINRPLLEPEGRSTAKMNGEGDNDSALEETDDEELVPLELPGDSKEQWDCESILSTYSNIYNRPKLIQEPAVSSPFLLFSLMNGKCGKSN